MRLVRYHIVKDGDHLAVLLHLPCDISQRRGKVRHPVSDNQHVRLPVADLPVCADIRKRIGRIQQRCALYRYGLIVRCYILCLSREEEFRILAAEIEGLDIVISAQFTIKACVKLRDSPSVGIKAGQYSYFQVSAYFFSFLLLMYSSLRPARTSSVMLSAASATITGAPPVLVRIIAYCFSAL